MAFNDNRPDGRLVPVFSVDNYLYGADMVLALSQTAAARGETVLMLDQMGGSLMHKAGFDVRATLDDVLSGAAHISDAKYIDHSEHFTAASAGETDLDILLGSLAALSLNYDWVFVAAKPGCTPAHVRLAGAADASLMVFDANGDKFMRAYWMLDAVRARIAKFDPLMIAQGEQAKCFETYELLTGTIREFLGAAPALGGILETLKSAQDIAPALLEAMRQDSTDNMRATA